MTPTLKTKVSALFPGRRARDLGGPRLDLLLPRDWPQAGVTGIPIAWRRRSRTGEIQTGHGTLEDLPTVDSAPLCVWTPSTETLLTRATLPTRARAKVAQALPYALEEQLLEDPAQLHFAWRREDDGSLSVAVTAKERLRAWLAAFRDIGMKPVAFSPAQLALPWSPACWSAAFVGDELLVRTGPASGFTCAGSASAPPALLLANLQQARADERAPEYLIVFQPPEGFGADAWTTALDVPVRIEAQSFWDTPGDSEPALNLLQGEFAPADEMRQRLRPLLPAAIMFGIWLVGTIAFDGVEWWRLYQRHRDHTNEMTALLLSAFPETKTILDPAEQLRRNLESLQGKSGMRAQDLLPMLGRTARAWQADPRVRMRGLRYVDRSLTLDVVASDGQAIEGLRRALQAGGLQAEVLNTVPRATETEARLRIQAPAAGTATRS